MGETRSATQNREQQFAKCNAEEKDLLETISATQIREKLFAECSVEEKDLSETIPATQIREKQFAACNAEEKDLLETTSAPLAAMATTISRLKRKPNSWDALSNWLLGSCP